MNGRLEHQVALITGATRGIGWAMAKSFLQEGARVAFCGRESETLRSAADRLAKFGEVLPIQCDVSKLDEVEQMVQMTIERFERIDILVNNAGISMTFGRVGEIDPRRWAYVVAVNLIGTYFCCHAVLPHMVERQRGKIINLKGYGADFPSPRVTAYGASKAAIVAFSRSLAREYKGTGITVNYLSPGVVRTELILNREATEEALPQLEKMGWIVDLLAVPVEDSAALAVRMASSASDGITGREFRVMTKRRLLGRLIRFGWRRLVSHRGRAIGDE